MSVVLGLSRFGRDIADIDVTTLDPELPHTCARSINTVDKTTAELVDSLTQHLELLGIVGHWLCEQKIIERQLLGTWTHKSTKPLRTSTYQLYIDIKSASIHYRIEHIDSGTSGQEIVADDNYIALRILSTFTYGFETFEREIAQAIALIAYKHNLNPLSLAA